MLVTAPSRVNSPHDVRLLPISPCIGAGVPVPHNGGRDYWGKPISATDAPNIGAE